MTDKFPSKSALYQRNRRLRLKEAKEKELSKIDRQIALASKKQKIIAKVHKESNWDFKGRDPQSNLVPQYQNEGYEQYNFWGRKEGNDNILNSISHQQNLKALFFDRAE